MGQAWVYRLGNSTVRVENAFSWVGWAQERLLVNDEQVKSAQGWLGTTRDFDEEWLSPTGEGVLKIRLVSRLLGIDCSLTLDERPIDPEDLESATWAGARGEWPARDVWTTAGKRRWHAARRQPPL